MGFEMIKEKYTGSIKEVTLGKGEKAVKVGGETCLPFCQFEGEIPNKPKLAMEVWDMEPPEWPEAAIAPFKDCINDPAAWAKKCEQEYGAEMVALLLRSTDPNEKDTSPEEASATVKKVLEAVNVPLIVWGTANTEKDAEVLKKIAEDCDGENLVIGPIEDANHKTIGAAAMGFGHTAIGSSPIDINLAKQVNILLENLGISLDRVIVDPTTGGLGYGMEYSYSVMERIKLAALTFGDDKLQLPMVNNMSFEVWKCKEAKQPVEEDPKIGDPERRDIMMEVVCAVSYLMAGSDILIMRHPEAIKMVKSFIDLLVDGGEAKEIAPVNKLLSEPEIDYASLSPEMDLSIEEEKKAAPAAAKKEEEAPKEERAAAAEPAKEETKPAEEAKPEPAKEETKPVEEAKAPEKPAEEPKVEEAKVKEEVEAKLRSELEDKIRKEMEDKIRREVESKAKSEAEAKAEAEEKAKKEAEEKARAEEEAKAKAEAEARAKMEADENAIREKVQKAQTKESAKTEDTVPHEVPKKGTDRILFELKKTHKKVA